MLANMDKEFALFIWKVTCLTSQIWIINVQKGYQNRNGAIHGEQALEVMWNWCFEALLKAEAAWPGETGQTKRGKLKFQTCHSLTGKSFYLSFLIKLFSKHPYLLNCLSNFKNSIKCYKIICDIFKISHHYVYSLVLNVACFMSAVSEKLKSRLSNYLWYGVVIFIDCIWGKKLDNCIKTVNTFQHTYFPVQQFVKKGPLTQEESEKIYFHCSCSCVFHKSFISLFLIDLLI